MEEIKQPLEKMVLKQKSNTYKMIIPQEVERKIRFACQQSWETEWSGTLFFNYEGSFEKDNLVIKCVDIFIMDVGNATYTEFDMSPDVIAYMTEHPELLDCQMGLIHSHNSMPTFFSGTDTATLREEGTDRNNFVSLIVNNAGTYTAAVTRKVKSTKNIKDCYSYEFFGEGTKESCKDYVTENEEIEYYMLDIEKSGDSFAEDMTARFAEIRAAKKNKAINNHYMTLAECVGEVDRHPKSTLGIEEPSHFNSLKDINNDTDVPYAAYSSASLNNNDFDDYIPYEYIRVKESILQSLVLQIITCSVIIPNKSKIDIKKWAVNIPELYKSRFGSKEVFQDWADTYLEFLTWNVDDSDLKTMGYTQSQIQQIVAYDVIEELEKLPQNEYIKAYIMQLEKYL